MMKKYAFLKVISIILFIASIIMIFVYSLLNSEASIGVFFVLFFLIGYFFIHFVVAQKSMLKYLFLLAYSLNVLIILFITITLDIHFGIPFLLSDELTFFGDGRGLALSWINNSVYDIYHSQLGYVHTVAIIYFFSNFFGDMSVITPKLFNAMFNSFIPVFIFLIAKRMYSNKVAWVSALICVFSPIYLFYSSFIVRDIIVSSLIIICVYIYMNLIDRSLKPNILSYITLIFSLVYLYYLRDTSFLLIVFIFLLYLIYKKVKFKWIGVLIITVLIILLFLFTDYMNVILDYISRYSDRAQKIYDDENSFAISYIFEAPFPLNVIFKFIYSIIIPFPPFREGNYLYIFRDVGVIIWYILIPFTLISIKHSFKSTKNNPFLLSIIIILLVVGVSQVTLNIRHNTQYLALAIIHASSGIFILKDRYYSIRNIILITLYLLALFVTIYLLLKNL